MIQEKKNKEDTYTTSRDERRNITSDPRDLKGYKRIL